MDEEPRTSWDLSTATAVLTGKPEQLPEDAPADPVPAALGDAGANAGAGSDPPGAGAGESKARAPGKRWRLPAVAVIAALVGGGAGGAVASTAGSGASPGTPVAVSSVSSVGPGPALAGGASIPSIVQKLLPEVVSIDATSPANGLGGGAQAKGSGMIVSSSGEILTNNHVIAGATAITVTLYGQTKALAATVVGTDVTADMALLQLTAPPANLPTVTFADSTKLQVGDALVVVGNALGLSNSTPTVTSGIVSALGRTVQAGDPNGSGATETLTNMIQTDAPINSGNSGGPIVDSSGDVIGMSTAVASSTAGNATAQNIGFGIPSSTLQLLLPQLRHGGTSPAGAATAYLGVQVEDETLQLQQAYGLSPSAGAVVVGVVAGSPAAAAGLQTGDVIVGIGSTAVTSASGLVAAVHALTPGQATTVSVWRGPQHLTLRLTAGSSPAA